MAVKYAFNTWPYGSHPKWLPSYPLTYAIRSLAEIGYDGIEIGCAAPHAFPAYCDATWRRETRALLDDTGLQLSSVLPALGGGPGANPASVLTEERSYSLRYYKEVVDFAADLGGAPVLYVAGWVAFGTTRDEAWQRSRDVLLQTAEHAQDRGIDIIVEPTSADSNLVDSADDALAMMTEVGLPNVGVMFDTYHALYRNEVPSDYVHRMGHHLRHIHLADRDRKAPGDGGGDFLSVLKAARDTGYDGYMAMEIGIGSRATQPDDLARRALAYMRSLESSL